MTRRGKLEARLEKRTEWADKAEHRADVRRCKVTAEDCGRASCRAMSGQVNHSYCAFHAGPPASRRLLTGQDVERMMEEESAAEARAHALLDEIGEGAFIDALRSRGYLVEEAS